MSEEGDFERNADVRDLFVTDGRAYLATNGESAHFRVLDVSDLPDVVTLAALHLSGNPAPKAIDYVDESLYAVMDTANSSNFVVLSAPSNGTLSLSGTLNLPSANTGVYVVGDAAFVSTADPTRGVTVVDVTQPTTPAFLASWATAGAASAITADDGVVSVAASDNAAELQLFSVPVEP